MQTDKSLSTMRDVYASLKSDRDASALTNRDAMVIDNSSIGSCVVVGALSWLVLFSLYQWLA